MVIWQNIYSLDKINCYWLINQKFWMPNLVRLVDCVHGKILVCNTDCSRPAVWPLSNIACTWWIQNCKLIMAYNLHLIYRKSVWYHVANLRVNLNDQPMLRDGEKLPSNSWKYCPGCTHFLNYTELWAPCSSLQFLHRIAILTAIRLPVFIWIIAFHLWHGVAAGK